MAATLVAATVVDLRDASVSQRSVASLGLGFRRSGLTEHEVVVAARLALRAGDRDEAEARIAEIVAWRRANQPGGQNAGSVFVNPRPEAAGKLIDDCGLRGLRIGSAEVSTKHANFIQADDGGRAADVVAVMRAVRERVLAERGVLLRSEIRLVGFPAEDPPFDVGIGYPLDEIEEDR
jgi:UDP-N-acetylmuramate dehydrogenase